MSNDKEIRENYAHKMRAKILNNTSLDHVTKDVLIDMFDKLHDGLIWVNAINSRLKDVESGINDKDAQERR